MFAMGQLWAKSQGKLKTGWFITAALVAFYVGAIEPQHRGRAVAEIRMTGLSTQVAPLRNNGESFHTTLQAGVRGEVPGDIPRGSEGGIRTVTAALGPPGDQLESPSSPEPERKLVRTGSLDLVVENPGATCEKVQQIADGVKGFLVSSQVTGARGAKSAAITIRVPAARFEEVRAQIRKLGLSVNSDRVEAEDVTRTYVDRQAQLRNLRAQEQQYLGILKRAATVKDTRKSANN